MCNASFISWMADFGASGSLAAAEKRAALDYACFGGIAGGYSVPAGMDATR